MRWWWAMLGRVALPGRELLQDLIDSLIALAIE